MADIAKSGLPSLSTAVPGPEHRLSGLYAGEAIAAGDALYVKSDGKLWKCVATTTATDQSNFCIGFAAIAAAVGDSVTAYHGVRFNYGAALTPGTPYYLSTTAGAIADASTSGATGIVAFAVDATRVEVKRNI